VLFFGRLQAALGNAQAVTGGTGMNVLESEHVCSKHVVFREPFPVWDQFHVDWVPTLNLGKKKYVEKDFKQVVEKAERAKKR